MYLARLSIATLFVSLSSAASAGIFDWATDIVEDITDAVSDSMTCTYKYEISYDANANDTDNDFSITDVKLKYLSWGSWESHTFDASPTLNYVTPKPSQQI